MQTLIDYVKVWNELIAKKCHKRGSGGPIQVDFSMSQRFASTSDYNEHQVQLHKERLRQELASNPDGGNWERTGTTCTINLDKLILVHESRRETRTLPDVSAFTFCRGNSLRRRRKLKPSGNVLVFCPLSFTCITKQCRTRKELMAEKLNWPQFLLFL